MWSNYKYIVYIKLCLSYISTFHYQSLMCVLWLISFLTYMDIITSGCHECLPFSWYHNAIFLFLLIKNKHYKKCTLNKSKRSETQSHSKNGIIRHIYTLVGFLLYFLKQMQSCSCHWKDYGKICHFKLRVHRHFSHTLYWGC